MIYTADTGVHGLTLPKRYTAAKGARITLSPHELAAAIRSAELPMVELGSYGAIPVAGLAALVVLINLIGNSGHIGNPVHPKSPTAGPATTSRLQLAAIDGIIHSNKAATRSNGKTRPGKQTVPAASPATTAVSTTTTSAIGGRGGTLVDPVMTVPAVPVGSAGSSLPVGGSGGGATASLVPITVTSPEPAPTTTTTDGATTAVTTPVGSTSVNLSQPAASTNLTPLAPLNTTGSGNSGPLGL